MSYNSNDYPLEMFLKRKPESEKDVLFNKVTVFLYRVYDILSLLRQWKLSSGEQRTALAAKFQEPMVPVNGLLVPSMKPWNPLSMMVWLK